MNDHQREYAKHFEETQRLREDLRAAGINLTLEEIADYAAGMLDQEALDRLCAKLSMHPTAKHALYKLKGLQRSLMEISRVAWREGFVRSEGDIQTALVSHAMAALGAATPEIRARTGLSLLLALGGEEGVSKQEMEKALQQGIDNLRGVQTIENLKNIDPDQLN